VLDEVVRLLEGMVGPLVFELVVVVLAKRTAISLVC